MNKVQVKVTPSMIKEAKTLVCSHCGCPDFLPSVTIKKLSKLHGENPTGQDILINLPANVFCVRCRMPADPVEASERSQKIVKPNNVKVDVKWKQKN
jgi:hypothetical protein